MKKFLNLWHILVVLLTATVPLGAMADTTYFSDTFTSGSTLNQPPTSPTLNSTSYETGTGLAGGSSSLTSGDLKITFPNTTSVLGEFYALFTNSPVTLSTVGDHIAIIVVFTNTANILSGSSTIGSSTLNIGLFNSGGVAPNKGDIVLSSFTNVTTSGGTENWIGYSSRMFAGGNSTIFTRPAQAVNGTTSQNQDLAFHRVPAAPKHSTLPPAHPLDPRRHPSPPLHRVQLIHCN